MARKPLQCEPFDVYIVQDDGATAVSEFAPICTPPVFDAGGCTAIGSATIDYSATANVQNPDTAKRC